MKCAQKLIHLWLINTSSWGMWPWKSFLQTHTSIRNKKWISINLGFPLKIVPVLKYFKMHSFKQLQICKGKYRRVFIKWKMQIFGYFQFQTPGNCLSRLVCLSGHLPRRKERWYPIFQGFSPHVLWLEFVTPLGTRSSLG